jgi:hypothetical protein
MSLHEINQYRERSLSLKTAGVPWEIYALISECLYPL